MQVQCSGRAFWMQFKSLLPFLNYMSTFHFANFCVILPIPSCDGARGSVVGWSTMLQDGRSRLWFPMSLDILNVSNPSSRTMSVGFIQFLREMSARNLSRRAKGGGRVSMTTLRPFESWLSKTCGSLDVSQLYGPPRPVTGTALLSFLFYPFFS
jgi:hypothetical protein